MSRDVSRSPASSGVLSSPSTATGGSLVPSLPGAGSTPSVVAVPPPSMPALAIDVFRERYPLCIVWTPIPLITWVLPFVGHMGICDSAGIIYDFAGPYYVGAENFSFGIGPGNGPAKYWSLKSRLLPSMMRTNISGTGEEDRAPLTADGVRQDKAAIAEFDRALATTTEYFRRSQWYNFFTNNCHSFVAYSLEAGQVSKPTSWNMVRLAVMVFFLGKYVSVGRFLQTHVPFFIILASILWFTLG